MILTHLRQRGQPTGTAEEELLRQFNDLRRPHRGQIKAQLDVRG